MKNDTKTVNEMVSTIEEKACYNNPGEAAKEAVAEFDADYVIIPRSVLPIVTRTSTGMARLPNMTEHAALGSTSEMRRIAYEYLAMADYLDDKKEDAAAQKLRKAQWEAYSTIYPYQNMYEFETFDYKENTQVNIQRAIDEIVKLRAQI